MSAWTEAQDWERSWWLLNRNYHAGEIMKSQFVAKMLQIDQGRPHSSVIDIGCGPLSLLLRLQVREGTALDPLQFDDLEEGYRAKGIRRLVMPAELLATSRKYDEAWIYNCLQHVQDPAAVLAKAKQVATTVRVFEWCYMKPYVGHLHELTPELFTTAFKGWRTLLQGMNYVDLPGLHGNFWIGVYAHSS